MDKHHYTTIKKARAMAFGRRCESSEAKALCRRVSHDIQSIETRKRCRKAIDQIAFDLAVDRIIADLLYAYTGKESKWAYRSLHNDTFIGEPVKAITFKTIINLMIDLGYVEQRKGGNMSGFNGVSKSGSDKSSYHPGDASRFMATRSFIKIANLNGIRVDTINSHIKTVELSKVVRIRASSRRSGRTKEKGRYIVPVENKTYIEACRRTESINKYLLKQSLQGGIFDGYQRLFNEGDRDDFDFNMGGRLYCLGGESYQSMKKVKRLRMLINGNPVVEIDVNASYLSILASLMGYELDTTRDVYEIEGVHREIVKAWVTATLGSDVFHGRWPANTVKMLKEKGIELDRSLSMSIVGERVCERLPFLSEWETCGIRWSHLMYQESECIIHAMETLISDFDVPSFGVHDSIIVPANKEQLAIRVLKSSYKSLVGAKCRVSVSRRVN